MKKINARMVFVILNYNNMNDTEDCIQSINLLNHSDECEIVLVDNASPNGCGPELRKRYEGQEHIHVILSPQNVGFSEGNNIGYRYAKEHFNTDLMVVCNNDVEFPDRDFIEKAEQIYQRTPFYVMGPDIYNPHQNSHQSPQGRKSPTYSQAFKTWLFNRLAYAFFPLYWIVYGKKQAQLLNARGNADPDWNVSMTNVPLQGACIIFSNLFIEAMDVAFEPDTFLYYEEYLLYNRCVQQGYLMLYSPEIQIIHHEGRARATREGTDRIKHRRLLFDYSHAAQVYMRSLKRNRS